MKVGSTTKRPTASPRPNISEIPIMTLIRLILSLFIRGNRGSMGTINFELNGYYEFYQAVKIILDGDLGAYIHIL